MMIRLDPPRRFGAHAIAILCEQRIGSGAWDADMFHFHGSKLPIAVLIATGSVVRACDLSGRPLDLEVLDAACPGLVRAMTGVGMP